MKMNWKINKKKKKSFRAMVCLYTLNDNNKIMESVWQWLKIDNL